MTQPSLTDFLLARLADDEAVARYANTGVARWESWNRSWDTEPQRDIVGGGVRLFTVPTMYDDHIARHDPARVLADVEASRARLRLADDIEGEADDGAYRWAASIAERIRRIEALRFADHPDYRAEWRP